MPLVGLRMLVAFVARLLDYLFMVLCAISMSITPFFFFQAEDGIRYLVRSRGLGDVYKRQLGAQAGQTAEVVQVQPGLFERGLEQPLRHLRPLGLSLIHI